MLTDIREHLIQEQEIGDVVFNNDKADIYSTNRSINNDKHLNNPDITTYIFNNNLKTKLYYKENGMVLPIRHQPRLHLNRDNGYGVHIVKYYKIYRDNYSVIGDILRYNILYNKEKSMEVLDRVNNILKDNDKSNKVNIKFRFITFVPESTILINNRVDVNNISILKDLEGYYTGDKSQRKQKVESVYNKQSLHIEINYEDNTNEQMYFKLGEDFVKIKSNATHNPNLSINAYIDGQPLLTTGYPVNADNRNILGLFTKKEMVNSQENITEQMSKLLNEELTVSKKKLAIVDDIRKVIINDEQTRLEVQKAIFKLTNEVNKSEINNVVNSYKDMLRGSRAETTVVSDVLKLFKAII